jgi:CheY-like chemotaxis protein
MMLKGKILLVDDDEDDQLIFTDALREIHFSFDCLIANNGHAGLAVLEREKNPPAMIFLDLNMPLMNGAEFLSQIKEHPIHRQIPVVIFTTSNNPLDKENMLKLGANRFITKMAEFKILKSKLSELLFEANKPDANY